MTEPGTLYLIPTPIGNPEDLSPRAARLLSACAVVAAEDTRVASERLRALGARPERLLSYWDHNESSRVPELISLLQSGKDVALISDAGTPLISDPGYRIVHACVEAGIPVQSIPGPCAAVVALAGSGLPTHAFYFGGFFPEKESARARMMEQVGGLEGSLIFYESPLRLPHTLDALARAWPQRSVCVARNLSKAFEQWLRGTPEAVRAALGDETRGEVVLVIGPAPAQEALPDDLDAQIDALLARGLSPREIRDTLAEARGLPKKQVYQKVMERAGRA